MGSETEVRNEAETTLKESGVCYHCGDPLDFEVHSTEGKFFCCGGCKMAYQLIQGAGLSFFYDNNKNPDLKRFKIDHEEGKFAYLDNPEIAHKIIRFEKGTLQQVWLDLPAIHCASCLQVLENLHRFDEGIIKVSVNFEKKKAHILYNSEKISLRKLVQLLASIGYEPRLTLENITGESDRHSNLELIYKLGVAGFCFGNIMLLSLPDYLAGSTELEANLGEWFKYMAMILSLPVFFFSSNAFFRPAWAGIKNGYVNMDAPVSLAIIATFVRSIVDVTFGWGTGYFDSMSGIVFFMLVGRYLQSRTHSSLSFDRDFRSYFPIAIETLIKDQFIPKALPDLQDGDIIRIRPGEIIPADGVVLDGKGHIDYSFVTGESAISVVEVGERVYSGGRQTRNLLTVKLNAEVAQSYLTSLWNKDAFRKKSLNRMARFDRIGRDFTWGVIAVAILAGVYWVFNDPSKSLDAATAVLIIACPCALLVTVAYTHGHLLNVLSNNQFYLRDSGVLSVLANPDAIIWDKTGTLTSQQKYKVQYKGDNLSEEDRKAISSLANLSLHPLSRMMVKHLNVKSVLKISDFEEVAGSGLKGKVGKHQFRIGSKKWVSGKNEDGPKSGSRVHISRDVHYLGYFELTNQYRKGILETVDQLSTKYPNVILSGDNDSEKNHLGRELKNPVEMYFEQLPGDKLEFLTKAEKKWGKTMMIGDGLNDAGALIQSDFGIAVTDHLNNFTPASDGIIHGDSLYRMGDFIKLASKGQKLIAGVFAYSALYNLVGIWFAVRAELSPMIAAIIMPLSSISIILITFTGVFFISKWLKLN